MAATSVVDDRAFERLYHRHVRDVYRFALSLVRNPSEAEDVTQTTFMNAYRALQAGEEPRRPHSWLLTIAHNTARSRVRRAMRRPREVPLEDVVTYLAVPEHERTNIRELLRALRRLPSKQRAAITMRELEGRSYPEIAATLGVTVPAVEALLARARRTLRLHAGAIRGLTVLVGLPRSLRRLFENPDATTGGAIGAGFIAKAAAVVVAAGVVAGGIGFSSGEASRPAPPAAVETLWPHADSGAFIAAPGWTRGAKGGTPAGGEATAARGHSQAIRRIGALPKPDSGSTADPEADLATTAPEASQPASVSASPSAQHPIRAAVQEHHPVRSSVDAAKQAVSTVTNAVAVPSVPLSPPVPVAPVEPPAVTAPALPAPPPPTPLPPLPSLP